MVAPQCIFEFGRRLASAIAVVAACGLGAAPLTDEDLHGPVFRPSYIERAVPERTVPEYGQVDRPYTATDLKRDWRDGLRSLRAAGDEAQKKGTTGDLSTEGLAADYREITAGLATVDVSDIVQSKMVACGPTAIPFLYHPVKGLIGVAGRVGKGRFALLGHNGILHRAGSGREGLDALLLNLARWCGGEERPVIGVLTEEKEVISDPFRGKVGPLADLFRERGMSVRATAFSGLDDVDVLFFRNSNTLSPAQVGLLKVFVESGKGFVVADTSWALMTSFDDYPIHAITRASGVFFTKQESWSKPGNCAIPGQPNLLLNLWYSSSRLRELLDSGSLVERQQAASVLGTAAGTGASFPGVKAVLADLNLKRGLVEITTSDRLDKGKRPLDAMLSRHQCRMLRALPAEDVPAHPSAGNWPGLPAPGAERLIRTLALDGNTPSAGHGHNRAERHTWRMTGLYAAPGEIVTVEIPPVLVDRDLQIQIGVHVDTLGRPDVIRRVPEILVRKPLTGAVTRVASAFGGLVAVLVPPDSSLGGFEATISGAIEAPFYVHGKTALTEWQRTRRHAPGAWGYVACPGIIFFVSRADLGTLDRPDHVMRHWETTIDLMDRLAGMHGQRRRPELAVPDIQISYGGAYAGYPYVTGWSGRTFISPNTIANGSWGDYHELGHTYQAAHLGNFKFVNGEVDVNWYPFYVCEKLHGRPDWNQRDWPHSTVNPENRIKGAAEILAGVGDGSRHWDGREWHMGLYDFYWQLKNAFGWELLEPVNGRMYAHAQTLEKPALPFEDKRNLWLRWACEASGHNLVPYFEAWGHKGIGDEIRRASAKLPVWTGNRAPNALAVDGLPSSLPEDAPSGELVCRLSAIDSDPGNRIRYLITAGNEDGAFALNQATGHLRVLGLDFERSERYDLTLAAADSAIPSLQSTRTVVIRVENRAEPPALTDQEIHARGPVAEGQSLGAVSATADTGRALVYELLGEGQAPAFSVDRDTGGITVADVSALGATGHVDLRIRVHHRGRPAETSSGRVRVHYGLVAGARCETWLGLDGSDVGSLIGSKAYRAEPARVDTIAALDTPADSAERYGQRLSALLVPTVTGDYTFWVASDDGSELQLSETSSTDGLRRIAAVRGWTGRHEWDKQKGQESEPVRLAAGRHYYVRVLHKEGGGGDHLAVAWQGPGMERKLIGAENLLVPPSH